jgi:type I restriction enzyme S subunit
METNWQTKKLGDEGILKMTSGGTPSRSNLKYYNGSILWLKSGELEDNQNITNSSEKITEEALKNSSAKIFPKGTVLLAMYGATAGKLGILGVNASTNQAVAGMIVNENVLDRRFLYYFLLQKREEIISSAWGGAQPNLSQTILKELEIPLPSLSEQKKIVKILDEKMGKIAEAKKLRVEALADTEKILSQTLLEIFEEGKKKGWEEKSFNDIAEVVGGGTPSTFKKDYWDNTYTWATPKDLGRLDSMYIERTDKNISKLGLKNSSAKLLPVGSVLFSSRAPIGYLAINTIPMATNQGCRSFICSKAVNNKFLYYFLIYKKEYIQSLGSGSTFAEISGSKLKEVKIIFPPILNQQKIVNRLDALFVKIRQAVELQKSQLEDFKKMEKAYLREAFNGELPEN